MGIRNHVSILVPSVARTIQMKQHTTILITLIIALIFAAVAMAQTTNKSAANGAKPEANQSSAASSSGNEGEKRFQTNCSRCHNAPETLSPREVRAVVRHMRVRAMLTAEDEKLIMEFLAP